MYQPLSAKDIAEFLLNRSGTALMEGDFPTFHSCFHLPLVVDTFEGQNVVQTAEDLERMFDDLRHACMSENISHLVRRCLEAEYRDADTICATHETRLIQGGAGLVGEPFAVMKIIRFIDGNWKTASGQYAITGPAAHVAVLHGRACQRNVGMEDRP